MQEIIRKAKMGDQAAVNDIFSAYKGLVLSLANRFYIVGGDKDDLLQEGMVGLYFAIMDYDENKGSFPAFVKLCVARRIINAVKEDGALKNKPLADYLEMASAEQLSDENTPFEMLVKKEFSQKYNKIVKDKLTPLENRVCSLFAEGYSYDDISVKLQKSYKAVDGALQRARKKLQSYLFEE